MMKYWLDMWTPSFFVKLELVTVSFGNEKKEDLSPLKAVNTLECFINSVLTLMSVFHFSPLVYMLLKRSLAELAANGRIFSDQTENTNTDTLSEGENATAFLPASLFQSITDRGLDNIGSFYAVYDTGALFPITNATTVVGSPVLAASIGLRLRFNELEEPVRILLRLNELGVSVRGRWFICQSVHG